MTDSVDDFLAHYGIRGMKWGIRKEVKPVSSEVQARRETRAQKFQVRADLANTKISELTTANESANRYGRFVNNRKIKDLTKDRNRNQKDADLKREGKLSTKQKRVAVGASVAAGIIITAAAVKAVDSGDLHAAVIRGKEFVTGTKHSWKKNDLLSRKDLDVDDIQAAVVKHINPDFGKFGTNMNCRRSTFAYEMRRRGYDVAATKSALATGQAPSGLFNATRRADQKKVSRNFFGAVGRLTKELGDESKGTLESDAFKKLVDKGGFGKEAISEISKNRDVRANAASIFDKLSKMPDGARGELGVQWAAVPAGHSIAWEVIKGKPTLIDAQMNKIISTPDGFAAIYSNIAKAGITRLDNATLDGAFLNRWLKDA